MSDKKTEKSRPLRYLDGYRVGRCHPDSRGALRPEAKSGRDY